ncbi:signal peptide protein [Paenibacillaceae sp. P-4]|uniref:signal peptide protein n=1 Tax=Paenibacillaceae bacterium P-4 TaxID=3160969 RepID=UPI0032E81CCC
MSLNRNSGSRNHDIRVQQQKKKRMINNLLVLGIFACLIIFFVYIINLGAEGNDNSIDTATVPWDYKIESAKVGDIIGGDMTILPDNQLLPNDNNYATGDQVWTLKYMTANMLPINEKGNDINLSSWEPIKSYPSKEAAERDLKELKLNLKAEVELVGVYKTEYQGKHRQFAVITLPSGHTVKQPIDDVRYQKFKNKKKVSVMLEEVHDFVDYDLAMAKFRGWAE